MITFLRNVTESGLSTQLCYGTSANVQPPQNKNQQSEYIQAVVCTELGKPLSIQKVPRPVLGSNQVRIKVKYVALNFADILRVNGKYQEKSEPPFVPGMELTGEIIETDSIDSSLKVGDKVSGLCFSPCALQQEVTLDKNLVYKIPDGLSLDVAASLVTSYATAYLALKHTAGITKGQTVFCTAAAGAVGLAIADLSINVFGCQFIGAVGSDSKKAILESKGAKHVINYTTENIKQKLKEITKNKGVNVALDNVGGDAFLDCLKSLAFEGKLVTIGYASGKIPSIPANLLLLKSASVSGIYWGSYAIRNPPLFRESILKVLELAACRKIKPVFSEPFPFDKVNEAIEFVLARKSIGKVLISVQ